MHIAFDTSATYVTNAGTATYIRGLISGLRKIGPDLQITELSCRPLFSRKRKLLRIFDTLYRELIWINFVLPALAKKAGADILHCPAMMAPWKCRIPIVLTILDIFVARNPRSFPLWLRTIMSFTLRHALKSSEVIISISDFTKAEVSSFFPFVGLEKITTSLLGVDPNFQPVSNPQIQTEFLNKYSINKPFILSVSTIEPRKNLRGLLSAFSLIKDEIPHDLLLIGPSGWLSNDVPQLIESLQLTKRVQFLGFVDYKELPVAYSLASVFVYISLYEGFGLPPLEAMACGCPVITSNVASLPEVVGDAALMVNPLIAQETSASIVKLLENPVLRASLVDKGIKRAQLFSWEKCAEITLFAYRQILSNNTTHRKQLNQDRGRIQKDH